LVIFVRRKWYLLWVDENAETNSSRKFLIYFVFISIIQLN
jgi:hypothetical protein